MKNGRVKQLNSTIFPSLIEAELEKALFGADGTLLEMCSHTAKAGGKRIRPLLVLYSGLVFSGLSDELVKASVASELIHMASLVHDDIIDHSDLRRNKPSLNYLWGNHLSVLGGDYLFARAFGTLSGNRLLKSLDLMIEAIESMCRGEILQAQNKFKSDMDLSSYYSQIAGKTAVFFQCCCQSGASISCMDQNQLHALGEYGLNLGLAFQMVDDILDFLGDVKKMGKPAGEDLRQGVITLPVILLLSDDKYSSTVSELIRTQRFEAHEIEMVNGMLTESGAIDRSFKIANTHIDKARIALDVLPRSEYTDFLCKLPDLLQANFIQCSEFANTPKDPANMVI